MSDARQRLADAGLPEEIIERIMASINAGDVDAALDAMIDAVFDLCGFSGMSSASLRQITSAGA